MFRRVATPVALAVTGKRFYKPTEDLKKLFDSEFEKGTFPIDIVPSDSATFAKFLFKAAEGKKSLDAVLKDFETIDKAQKTLPVFWERSIAVEEAAEFKSLNPAMIFTMKWMSANGMLENLSSVRSIFVTLVDAQKKRVVAKVYLPGPEAKHGDLVKQAKEVAQQLHKANASLNGFNMEYNFIVDAEFQSGFAVDVAGAFYSTAKGAETAAEGQQDVDYTNLPPQKIVKTKWDDSVETEVLGKYLDQLAAFDLEEQKFGV